MTDPAEFLPVSTLKNFLKLTSTPDAEIEDLREATLAHVRSRVVLAVGTDLATVKARPRLGTLFLPVMGDLELVSIEDPSGNTVPVDSVDASDIDAGMIGLGEISAAGVYRVTVRFPQASKDVELACKHIAKHLWSITRRGSQGGARADADAQGEVLQGFAIPRRAEQLLKPYEKTGGFA